MKTVALKQYTLKDFSKQELEILGEAIIRTWQYISDEMPEKTSMAVQIEVTLDADRVFMHGRSHGTSRDISVDDWKKLYVKFNLLSNADMNKMARARFKGMVSWQKFLLSCLSKARTTQRRPK